MSFLRIVIFVVFVGWMKRFFFVSFFCVLRIFLLFMVVYFQFKLWSNLRMVFLFGGYGFVMVFVIVFGFLKCFIFLFFLLKVLYIGEQFLVWIVISVGSFLMSLFFFSLMKFLVIFLNRLFEFVGIKMQLGVSFFVILKVIFLQFLMWNGLLELMKYILSFLFSFRFLKQSFL